MSTKTIKHAVFVPIYNIKVSNNVLNTPIFGDYILVRSSCVQNKYDKYIFEHDHFARQFIQDITDRHPDKSLFFSSAEIILVKEIENIDTDEENRKTAIAIKKEIENIILALRLADKGFCQVNNCYILSCDHSRCQQLGVTSKLENIVVPHRTATGKLVREDIYNLNNVTLNKATYTYNLLQSIKANTFVPTTYFNRYYDSLTPHERIIQMAIVFESSMLAGTADELNYRMILRTSALLGRNVEDLMKLFYAIRSNIIHNGNIGQNKGYKDIIKKLKKVTNVDSDDETELLFYFVKDHIEPICREVISKSLKIFVDNDVNDFEDLVKALDRFILEQLTNQKFELRNNG